MADSILRLKVESQEYDAKLKRAADGLQRYADECRKVGGTMEKVEKDTLDYVRSIGKMETTSRSATGKLSEMRKAFVELSAQYNQLTDKEKQSPFGKALAQSLDQLKGRINESKQQLDEINKSIGGTGGGGGLSGALDTLESKFGMSIKSIGLWGAALGAGKVALDVMKDAFFFNEQQLDDWNRTVEVSKGLYDGFLNALNSGDISGFLSNMNDIVRAAEAAYNAMDELGTFNAFNSINLEGAQADFQEALSGFRTKEKSKEDVETAAQKYKKELEDRRKKEWDAYIEAVRNSATIRGANPDDVVKALQGSYQDWDNLKHSNLVGSGEKLRYNPLSRGYDTVHYAATDAEKLSEFARQINDTELKALQEMGAQAERTRREAASIDKQMARVLNSKQGGGAISPTKTSGTVANVPGSVADLNAQIAELRKQQQQVTDFAGWERYEKWIHEITLQVKELKGELGLDAIGNTLGSVKAASISGMAQGYDWAKGREDLIKRGDKQIRSFKGVQVQEDRKTEASLTKELGQITSGVTGIFSGIESLGIELPQGMKDVVGGIQGVITILTSISTIVTAIEAIAGADAIIPFARGGVVPHAAGGYFIPGNNYSGDITPIMANAGELVLNKSSQNNLASMITEAESRGNGGNGMARVSGEQIWVALNAFTKRTGKGELVTWK